MAHIQIAQYFKDIDYLDKEISYREGVIRDNLELLNLMEGQLYPPIVRGKIYDINQEIEILKKRREEIEKICESNKEYLLKKWNLQ